MDIVWILSEGEDLEGEYVLADGDLFELAVW